MKLKKYFSLLITTSILLIEPTFCAFTYTDCGTKNGTCLIECNALDIQHYNKRWYEPEFTACILKSLTHNAVTKEQSTEIDISHGNIVLNHMPEKLVGVNKGIVKTLNLSGNFFHYYGPQ